MLDFAKPSRDCPDDPEMSASQIYLVAQRFAV
jgi:hypothetical protein